jgi:squalene-hopene/tetraprenyl-beta-curcumene cyclase
MTSAGLALESAGPMGLGVSLEEVDRIVEDAAGHLAQRQHDDGYLVYDLEADATIASEYIMLEHYLDMIDAPLETELAQYIRSLQGAHGGWPLFYEGDFDMSATVKARSRLISP